VRGFFLFNQEAEMPDWIPQLGAAGAVIVVVVYFLQALDKFGDSRDAERQQFLDTLEQSQQALLGLIGLANRMVDKCQTCVPPADRITQSDIVAVGTTKKGH
jgi:hypothetical protein